MKKLIVFAALFLFCSSTVFAGPFDAFNLALDSSRITKKQAQDYLDAFTKDLGQAISGGSYGVGTGLGALGIYLSIKMSYQQVSGANKIVRYTSEDAIYYPIVQGEIALHDKFDLIARISHFNDSTLFGGGLRYKIMEGRDLIIPTISAQSVYNYVVADTFFYKFNAWNLKTGLTAYFGEIPIINPYVFINYDITAFNPISSDFASLSSNAFGFGYGAGASVTLSNVNLSFSLSMYDNQPNYNFGVFIGI